MVKIDASWYNVLQPQFEATRADAMYTKSDIDSQIRAVIDNLLSGVSNAMSAILHNNVF